MKASGKLAIIWKNPDSFETTRKIIWKSGIWIALKVLGQFKGLALLYAQKLSGREKTFRVAMLPCYPGFCASVLLPWAYTEEKPDNIDQLTEVII